MFQPDRGIRKRHRPSRHVGVGWLAFLSLVSLSSVAVAHGGRDTITVDGQPLELQLDIMEVAPFVEGPSKGKVRRTARPGPDWVLALGMGAVQHPDDALGTRVSRFAGKGARPALDLRVGPEWSGDRGFLRMTMGFQSYRDWSFISTALDDSLYALAPDGAGGLEQWTSSFYPSLGIELDTLPVPMEPHRVMAASFGLSFGGAWSTSRGDQGVGRSRWWAGFHGRFSASGRGPTEINRVALDAVPAPPGQEGAARHDWEAPRHVDWGVQGGASGPLGDTAWDWTCILDWSGGRVSRWAAVLGVQYRMGGAH